MDFMLNRVSEEYREGFRELLTERGYRCREGVSVRIEAGTPGRISVEYRAGQAVIRADRRVFFYRGLMTLVMRLEQSDQEFYQEEKVWLEHNGIMLDCSRNCVASVPAVKAWIRLHAALGMDQMMLYTEDTYELPDYPYFGSLRGRYKEKELRELDRYAAMLGVELIPCIQALGHLQQPLKWRAMEGLRDTSDILLVGDARVYELIQSCLRQVSRCFTTRKVHLGMMRRGHWDLETT